VVASNGGTMQPGFLSDVVHANGRWVAAGRNGKSITGPWTPGAKFPNGVGDIAYGWVRWRSGRTLPIGATVFALHACRARTSATGAPRDSSRGPAPSRGGERRRAARAGKKYPVCAKMCRDLQQYSPKDRRELIILTRSLSSCSARKLLRPSSSARVGCSEEVSTWQIADN